MRAVNLIPADLRRGGGGGAAGRTGGAVYVLVGGLVALVAMAVAYGITTHRITQRKIDIATTTRQAQVAQARAAALQPYVDVQTRRASRVTLVSQLANQRFDWSVAMQQIAEVLPRDANLLKVVGNDSPAAPAGGGGGVGGLRGAIPVPAIELTGCAPTQPRTAAVMDALNTITGITVVSLSSSVKSGQSTGGGGCPAHWANFDVDIYYTHATAPNAPAATAAPAGARPVAAGATGAAR